MMTERESLLLWPGYVEGVICHRVSLSNLANRKPNEQGRVSEQDVDHLPQI